MSGPEPEQETTGHMIWGTVDYVMAWPDCLVWVIITDDLYQAAHTAVPTKEGLQGHDA